MRSSEPRAFPGVVFEQLSNEVSVDENSSACRTHFIAFLSGDALQDRHMDRQITALVRKLSDRLPTENGPDAVSDRRLSFQRTDDCARIDTKSASASPTSGFADD